MVRIVVQDVIGKVHRVSVIEGMGRALNVLAARIENNEIATGCRASAVTHFPIEIVSQLISTFLSARRPIVQPLLSSAAGCPPWTPPARDRSSRSSRSMPPRRNMAKAPPRWMEPKTFDVRTVARMLAEHGMPFGVPAGQVVEVGLEAPR